MIFDHQRTVARLDALPVRLRASVGVVCLERVLPIAEAIGDTHAIQEVLDQVARFATGGDVSLAEIERSLARIQEGVPRVTETRMRKPLPVDDDREDDVEEEEEEVATEAPRGALDRMTSTLEHGVGALTRIVLPREDAPSAVVATAMAAACEVVERLGHYGDAKGPLAFEELSWQGRVLTDAEAGKDLAHLRTLLRPQPDWMDVLDDAF